MPTRDGTTETSSTSRRESSSSRDARPTTAFAIDGGSSSVVPRRQELGDVERIPARGRVDLVGAVAGEGADRALRQRRQLDATSPRMPPTVA